MKRTILFVILSCLAAFGQTTNVTATITDSDSIVWANGSFTVTFVPKPGAPGPYVYNGSTMTNAQKGPYTGTMNASGAMAVSLPDNTFITPSGAQWLFTLCPNSSGPCSTVQTAVSGGARSFTALFSSSVAAPRFPATGVGAYGYSDVEVTPTPGIGGSYFNVTNGCVRVWDSSIWRCNGDNIFVRRDGSNTVTGNILPDNDNARNLGSSSRRYNIFSNLLTASSFNGSKWLDGITYTTLKSCYDAACSGTPFGGGTCFVPPSYTETLTTDLVLDKHDCGIKAMGSATILQGSNHVVFTPGTTGTFLEGPSIAGGPAAASNGFRFIYTGTGPAWQVGSSSVSLSVQYPGIKNIWIDITNAGTNALGIQAFGLGHARLDSNFINCIAGVSGQIGFSIDDAAGGAFSGGIDSDHLLINNCHTDFRLNGSTVESTFNNNIFLSGGYAGGTGLDLNGTDVASNVFSGGTISGFPTSINFGGNASNNVVTVETDAETTAVVFGSTTHHNEVVRMDSTNHATPVVTCAGVMNVVRNPGGEYFCGGNLLSDQGALTAQTGDGTDKVIYTYTVKSGSVAPGKGLRVTYGWNNGSLNSVTYKVLAGATLLASIASTGVDGSANEGFTFDITNLAGVQNSQNYVRHQKIRDVNVANVTFNNQAEVYGTSTVDFTVDQTFTATFNVANPNTINPRMFRVELIQ